MLFNSPVFILAFLPIVLVAFYVLGALGLVRAAVAWLVAASLFFYGYWNPVYLGLIAVSILVNFQIGLRLSGGGPQRNATLAAGIILNLALLGYFKYANFFVDSLNQLGWTDLRIDSIVLPLAISFFTFQQIAYLVDAWKGEASEYSFLHYCLFVTFFPQLIAGPIVHHREMLPQFMDARTYKLKYINLAVGLSIFLIGLFKKVIIADSLALTASPIYAAAETGAALDFFQSFTAMTGYTFQLYFDFSGYTDMAIGIARMFGIRLPLNFDSPYQAINITDFWRRWHMTLSRFLRDYLYIPLGGNRKGEARRYVNLIITMLLGGLWHGAGWTFVFWGALHGLYLMVNHAWQKLWRNPIGAWWSVGIARFVTLIFVMIAWVFFRAETFGGALQILAGFTNLPYSWYANLGVLGDALVSAGFEFRGRGFNAAAQDALRNFVILLAVVWFLPNTQQFFARYRPAFGFRLRPERYGPLQAASGVWFWKPAVLWSVWIGALGSYALLNLSRVSEFLYFQF